MSDTFHDFNETKEKWLSHKNLYNERENDRDKSIATKSVDLC